jgi:protoporphyrinogen oxidase
MPEARKIAVIGAGPMGLAVAYQAARDGHDVTIYEADDRLGGMSASFAFDGLRIERFYHFICTSDIPLFEILNELGIQDRLRWVATRMGYYYQGGLHAWGNPVALLKFPGLGIVDKIRYGAHVFLSTKRKRWQPLDRLESTQWIKSWIGEKAYDVLWRRLFALKFYDYADTLSAAWIWTRIKRIGLSRSSMMREKLGYLDGGSDTLLNALQADIEARGGKINLATPVQRILHEGGKISGLLIGGEKIAFDFVVSTAPMPFVPRLIPDLPELTLNQYKALKNIAVVCVIVKTARPVTANFWLNINDPEMDIPGLVEFSNLYRNLPGHITYIPFYMPGEHEKYAEPDSAFDTKVRNYLRRINPELTDQDILAVHVNRYRFAQPVCGPGYLATLPPIAAQISGLFIADTSYYYPEDRGISESVKLGRDIARMIPK